MASLLNISERAAIALHAVGALARSGETVLPTKDIANLERVSEAHLAKVMRQLVNAGIVSSSVGPGGGFKLARPAETLTLLEILDLIDGPIGDTHCILTPARNDCSTCIYKWMTEPVNVFVRKFLGTVSAADMAHPSGDIVAKLQAAGLVDQAGKGEITIPAPKGDV